MDYLGLSDFGLLDAIEVLIVAYLIYRILVLIRGTRAVRMAVGLILLFLFDIVARRIGMETVDWLLSTIFTYIAFAIIVLFAPEMRRALATLGRTAIFGGRPRVTERPFEEIITAVAAMSAKRCGAIIVIERSVGLRNYVQAGIEVDAIVSYDLLVSIFHIESPMHDGAVIIQGDRVAAASCFLPLTQNPRLLRQTGSRHRAAIGISEESDAVAIVVSEESGAISLAIGGKITKRMDATNLRCQLEDYLQPLHPSRQETHPAGDAVGGENFAERAPE